MEFVPVGTERAYELIREKIVTLELAPGAIVNEQTLAEELGMPAAPVREALRFLAREGLVVVTPRHGLYVSDVNLPDLEQLSEMRLTLETTSARLAAQRATSDDLVVLEALLKELAATPAGAARRLLELDHKFHQAMARAAHNTYLSDTLERFFGLSQRLWFLALPQLGFLPSAVKEHLELVQAIKAGDADRAGRMMHDHVAEFYTKVRAVLPQEEK